MSVPPILSIEGVAKTYASGVEALKPVTLAIQRGEIFALLGPNGAGKSTLINIICGIVTPSAGQVVADGFDIKAQFREARQRIGLVPQELHTDAFETVWDTVRFSRGLFGCAPDPAFLQETLKALSLWDKKGAKIMTLSGGMKRRVMIAKALSHGPTILFLDEPTAGVDVELRRDMWALVRRLRSDGVTVILTTHYIEEAEEMADRIGVIAKGELILVEEKAALMARMGGRRLMVHLKTPLAALPSALALPGISLDEGGRTLTYAFNGAHADTGIADVLAAVARGGLDYSDLATEQSSLEDIFVTLVRQNA
jgi:ABC-2 type transport system ATP-binding protein